MNDDNSLDQICCYKKQALRMMRIFKPDTERFFYTWLNRFEYVAETIKVPHDKMAKFFVAMVQHDFHEHIMMTHTSKKTELSYKDLIHLYLSFFNQSNEINFNRYRFVSRCQYEKETFERYANSLKKICNQCNYKCNIEIILRKQFINGIRDKVIKSLISKISVINKLSFDQTVKRTIKFSKSNLINYYINQVSSMINAYYPEKEGPFFIWLNKFEYVIDDIGVTNDKIVELFNRMVYNSVHLSIGYTFPTIDFSKLSYNGIVNRYLRHFYPHEADLHINRLLHRKQYQNESIESYANSLFRLYNKCVYKNNIEGGLVRLFIRGLRDKIIKLFSSINRSLSFDLVVIKAIEYSKFDLMPYYKELACMDINPYNPEEGQFHLWYNIFEYRAKNIGVPNNRMIKFFDMMIDNDVQQNVKRSFPSINFDIISYDQIIDYYLLYFSNDYEYDLHRKRFYCRKQYHTETIRTYADNLSEIYKKVRHKNDPDKELSAIFINGLYCDDMKLHLINNQNLLFHELVEEAIRYDIEEIHKLHE